MLTQEQIEAIRKRAEAATPEHWYVKYGIDDAEVVHGNERWGVAVNDVANAEFIAHAREDVPALLAEIDRLKAKVDKLTGIIYEHVCEINLGGDGE